MDRACEIEHVGHYSLELARFGTSPTPKATWHRSLRKAEHLFDPAVAVGGDDEKWAGEGARVSYADHDVVMKLALSVVIEKLVVAEMLTDVFEQIAEREMRCERVEEVRHERTLACAEFSA
jgi:hypothetical protein